MSEMVERVALAIRESIRGQATPELIDTEVVARAAIAAMREPTKEQEAIMRDLLEREDRPPTKRWRWIWKTMIDEALK